MNWNELEGLELRRAACERLGWKLQPWLNTDGDNVMRLFDPQMNLVKWAYLVGEKTFYHKAGTGMNTIDLREFMPHIESSADISEKILDEECKKRGLRWHVGGPTERGAYGVRVYRELDDFNEVFAETSSLARARAIGMLLERDGGKP